MCDRFEAGPVVETGSAAIDDENLRSVPPYALADKPAGCQAWRRGRRDGNCLSQGFRAVSAAGRLPLLSPQAPDCPLPHRLEHLLDLPVRRAFDLPAFAGIGHPADDALIVGFAQHVDAEAFQDGTVVSLFRSSGPDSVVLQGVLQQGSFNPVPTECNIQTGCPFLCRGQKRCPATGIVDLDGIQVHGHIAVHYRDPCAAATAAAWLRSNLDGGFKRGFCCCTHVRPPIRDKPVWY